MPRLGPVWPWLAPYTGIRPWGCLCQDEGPGIHAAFTLSCLAFVPGAPAQAHVLGSGLRARIRLHVARHPASSTQGYRMKNGTSLLSELLNQSDCRLRQKSLKKKIFWSLNLRLGITFCGQGQRTVEHWWIVYDSLLTFEFL